MNENTIQNYVINEIGKAQMFVKIWGVSVRLHLGLCSLGPGSIRGPPFIGV